ncbi:MAG: helix-turn-helix domain-containing protein [Fimbriimonadaceae bacterium]|nr:helix-turn-helix domain-containing protein [Fimbriimonadaceae bacterium]
MKINEDICTGLASDENLLDENAVARILNLKPSCLRRWRMENRGPIFVRVGSRVKYRMADVQNFINACPTGGGKL